MSSFGRTSSPVLTMPLPSAHQVPFGRPLSMHHSASFGHAPSWGQTFAQTAAQVPRGRKRSRDEAAVNLDSPEKALPPVGPVKEAEDEWVYGPGMILIKKSTGYVHDASNQSGTWVEDKKDAEAAQKVDEAILLRQREAQDRPSLRSHKSSRLGSSSSSSGRDVSVNRSGPGNDGAVDAASGTLGDVGLSQPVVDDFTLHLGIGWSRISDSDHIQAAARGWARYIENHYPITGAQIRLESKGLESYLVEANEGFFLFAENLRRGCLVSRDPTRALDNLKTSPPVFDGLETLMASTTPKPVKLDPMTTATTAMRSDVAMDMS